MESARAIIAPWKRERDVRLRGTRVAKPRARKSSVEVTVVSQSLVDPVHETVLQDSTVMVAAESVLEDHGQDDTSELSSQYQIPEGDNDEISQGYVSFGDTDSLGSMGAMEVTSDFDQSEPLPGSESL